MAHLSSRTTSISKILIIEQLREPSALLWAGIAPCLIFVLLTYNKPGFAAAGYANGALWLYSYISANIALFGFSFYLIGRRESGFVRSFIYQRQAIRLFLCAHIICYSAISLMYSTLFYLITKPLYAPYALAEFIQLSACFYTSYLLFSCIGLAIAALPITFNTASTLFSLLSFLMLLSGYLGADNDHQGQMLLNALNPLALSKRLFQGDMPLFASFAAVSIALLAGVYATGRHFRIHPVWSRY